MFRTIKNTFNLINHVIEIELNFFLSVVSRRDEHNGDEDGTDDGYSMNQTYYKQ